jgi:hypothetical protein
LNFAARNGACGRCANRRLFAQHAEAANALLRKVFPTGYALDATHRPHITMLQRFVRTADLDKVYAAVGVSWPGRSRPDGR